ncbi:MAG: right-handed parallel beta-helix repeat-containing protein, partial [Planctomycetes bacterium]|nr:right-handed parallel beta-helix repeat-containing protein [Planctomycetota bacterium]
EHNWQADDQIVIWKRGAQDTLYFEEGSGLEVLNITVDSSPHYAIKLRGISNINIESCQVTPKQGAMISSCADGIDVQQSKNISITNCKLIATGDDGISLLNHKHGHNGHYLENKFQEPYPASNLNAILENNTIIGGNRNGILALCKNLVIRANIIKHVRQYGVKFTSSNVKIVNNQFEELGSFTAYKHIKDELNTGIICSDEWKQTNILIQGNEFKNWHHMPGIMLKAVRNAEVIANTFVLEHSSPQHNPGLETVKAIVIGMGEFNGHLLPCEDVILKDNIYQSELWSEKNHATFIQGQQNRIHIQD